MIFDFFILVILFVYIEIIPTVSAQNRFTLYQKKQSKIVETALGGSIGMHIYQKQGTGT